MSWDDLLDDISGTPKKDVDPFPEFGNTKPALLGQEFEVSQKFPDIQGMVMDYFDDLNSQPDPPHSPAFYPSTVAGKTCKHLYYHHYTTGRREQFGNQLRIIMDNGTDCHTRWQRYLAKHLLGTWKCTSCGSVLNENEKYHKIKPNDKVVYTSMTPQPMPEKCPSCGGHHFQYEEWRVVSDKYGYRGKIDGIINYRNEWVGLEIKSASPVSFDKFKGDYWLMDIYKKQFALYMDDLAIEKGVFLIENKGTQSTLTVPMLLSEVDLSEMKKTMLEVLAAKSVDDLGQPLLNKDCEKCIFKNRECNPV